VAASWPTDGASPPASDLGTATEASQIATTTGSIAVGVAGKPSIPELDGDTGSIERLLRYLAALVAAGHDQNPPKPEIIWADVWWRGEVWLP
jgi:hypothetical protein